MNFSAPYSCFFCGGDNNDDDDDAGGGLYVYIFEPSQAGRSNWKA